MKALNEFATLAEAQAYTYTNEKMASPDMVLSLLTQHDSVISLQNGATTDDKAAGFLLALQGSVTEFNVMNSHPVGQAQQQLLDYMVSQGFVTVEFKNALIGYANVSVQPYQNTTQQEFDDAKEIEIDLTPNTAAHNIEFTIAETVNPAKQVKIMQRYGTANDLTDWHELKQVQIRFHQDSYKAFIPQSNHEVRELKIISPVAVTVI